MNYYFKKHHAIATPNLSRKSRPLKFFAQIPIIAALCTACSSMPVSEHSMNKYIAENYGDAKLLRQEKEQKSITYFYEDTEYGFEYQIKSFSSGFTMDGSTFFNYEDKDSDFEEQYYACLTQQLSEELHQLEENYSVTIEPAEIKTGGYTVKSFGLADIVMHEDNQHLAPKISQAVADLYRDKDRRHFWKEGCVNVFTADHKSLGCFDIRQNCYLTPEENDIERFQVMAKQKDATSTYQYLKTISIEEFLQTASVSLDDLQDKDVETVTLYYFSTESGQLYYIANVIYQGDLFSTFQ